MKYYIFEEYRDNVGYGSVIYFDDQKEAVNNAIDEWERLTAADKASYLTDASIFHVYAIECTAEELDQVKDAELIADDFWVADIWDALS